MSNDKNWQLEENNGPPPNVHAEHIARLSLRIIELENTLLESAREIEYHLRAINELNSKISDLERKLRYGV